jgi:endonuclease/exonuclease/phosphatase family metal-dependent hydrolase
MSERKHRFFSFRTGWILYSLVAIALLGAAYLSPFTDPRNNANFAIFGLFYPVLLLVYQIALIGWIVGKNWIWTLVMGVFLLAGMPLHTRFIVFGTSKPDTTHREQLVVMSYNVRLFDVYQWLGDEKESRNAIFDFLREQQPDVVCFQEFYFEEKPANFLTKDTLKEILEAPYMKGVFTSANRNRTHFGVCTYSKYPIVSHGQVDLAASTASNSCVYTDIQKGEQIFRVYNIHIGSLQFQEEEYDLFSNKANTLDEEKRERTLRLLLRIRRAFITRNDQVDLILAHAAQSPYPVIVCGDFNDTPMSHTYHRFHSLYTDAFQAAGRGIGTTYAGRVPANRIDFIFYDTAFVATDFSIQKAVHSDHRAIQTTLWYRSTE